ncbi:MAG: hypothetical protein AAF702_10260 [Chloroflexota bacterium]
MTIQTMSSEEVKRQWGGILDNCLSGITTTIQRYSRPVAVIMGWKQWEDYQSLKKLHSQLLAERREQEGIPWEEVKADLIRDGVIDG